MEQKYSNRGSWLRTAVHEIRFAPDREAVRQELQEHIDDKVADLLRIFPGMTLVEAEERALSQMGDPEEIGKELGKIHKPWWGYLWKISRVAVALVGAVTAFYCFGWGVDAVSEWNEAKENAKEPPSAHECYMTGIDPYAPGAPHWDPENKWAEQTIRKPLKVFTPEDTAKAGNFTFSMPRAALWSITDEEGVETWWLYCELRVDGLPWEHFSNGAMRCIRAADSRGTEYFSDYDAHERNLIPPGKLLHVQGVKLETGTAFDLFRELIHMEPGAEWIEFTFDRGGETWSLTVPLMEGEA